MTAQTDTPSAKPLARILPQPAALPVWGRTPAERTRRELKKLGLAEQAATPAVETAAPELWLRGDAIFHQSVLKGLVANPGCALGDDQARPLALHLTAATTPAAALAWLQETGPLPPGLRAVRTTDVASLYNVTLRRRDDPYALRVTRDNLPALEKRLFMSTYKGVTDFVTKYWWPVPARIVTQWCVTLKFTPNFVTAISGVLAVVVCYLFAAGQFGLGLALGWVMTFLDTVDGKLARVTMTSSKFGDVLDHGIDLLHPLAWYYTWGMGLVATGLGADFVTMMLLIFGGYIAGRVCEGVFIKLHGFHLHVWRRFDSAFRLVLARRNPNMILLTLAVFVGRPDLGLWLVAWWTVATLAVHLVQVAQSVGARRRAPLRSWLETAP
jgi:phosphatidylglycerophosphate synthase